MNEGIAAISEVFKQIADEERERVEKSIFNRLLENNDLSEDDKKRLIESLFGQQNALNEKYQKQRNDNAAAITAKIEARRKLREARMKESALKKEINDFTQKMVSNMHLARKEFFIINVSCYTLHKFNVFFFKRAGWRDTL